eukprot:GHUV01029473.1.p1 GENE.GHUV01029473.1~~GHUV01029473.1.p1  ORF type:complete len:144 (-),score=12.07 GHUV01029473.1:449-880(-)
MLTSCATKTAVSVIRLVLLSLSLEVDMRHGAVVFMAVAVKYVLVVISALQAVSVDSTHYGRATFWLLWCCIVRCRLVASKEKLLLLQLFPCPAGRAPALARNMVPGLSHRSCWRTVSWYVSQQSLSAAGLTAKVSPCMIKQSA